MIFERGNMSGYCKDCGNQHCVCTEHKKSEDELGFRVVILVEVYSRVVGYFRPVNQWNPGKQAEFQDRKEYNYGAKNEKTPAL